MRSSTGRWVTGDDFFDRETELTRLEAQILDRNHLLLTGQRRIGKTSIARELGRRLQGRGWAFLFADVEGAACPEDVVADVAAAVHDSPIAPLFAEWVEHWVRNIGEIGESLTPASFRIKFRSGLDAGNWQRRGGSLIRSFAAHDEPVLLVIDELPIFLKRMLRGDGGERRVEEFLSWLRAAVQRLEDGSPVLVLSGSIGLAPLVRRLGLSDRINHLDAFRLGPWSREASVACFRRLADAHGLPVDDGVADAVYDKLGIGIPHHVQTFFARLRDFAAMRGRDRITLADVGEVYRAELLGPSGQNDLAYYESRLRDALDDDGSHAIAMEILAEAATQDVFAADARRALERFYAAVIDDAPGRIREALEILEHDGYLEADGDGYRFPSRLLKDWWAARFRDRHIPLTSRDVDEGRGGVR